MLRRTPFHARTSALCASQNWQEWSGFLSANSYEVDHMSEYNAVRTTCGLFDVSPLFKYHLRGRDAARLLDRIVTRDISKCRVGQVIYTAWCDDDGKIIDDGTVARLADDSFRLTAAIPTLDWLEDNAFGLEVAIEDTSERFAALALQGPTSRDLLQQLTGADLAGLRYYRLVEDKVAGAPAQLSRTGYTGDLGYEIFLEPGDAETVWDALLDAGGSYGLRPAGNIALDVARIEAGLLLIDVDFVRRLDDGRTRDRRRCAGEGVRGLRHAASPPLHVLEWRRAGVRRRRSAQARRQGDERHVVADPEELRGHRSRKGAARRTRQPRVRGRDHRGPALRRSRGGSEDAVLRSCA